MAVTPELTQQFLEPYEEAWTTLKDQRLKGDAWPWVRTCMRTRDEDAGAGGQQSEHLTVPNKPHLRIFTWAWYAVKLLQVDKSRQLMVTWMCCGLTVHEAMFTSSAKVGYQHITGADTAEKIEKYMLYILEAQPDDLMLPWVEERNHPPREWVERVAGFFELSMDPPHVPRADQPPYFGSEAYNIAKQLTNTYRKSSSAEGVVEVVLKPFFESDERTIEAIPAGPGGPNKWRGSTRSRVVHDEAWFHQSLAKNVNSAAKSAGQNGRQVLVSTANRGEDGDEYPLKMVKRAPKQPEVFGGFHGTPTKSIHDMPPGVEIWLTPFGYTHIRIWYHADPDKRSDQWYRDNVLTGDRRENDREVLIKYDASGGNPFYEMFNGQAQGVAERLVIPGSRYVVGMDGGRRPAAVLFEVSGSRVVAIAECVTPPDQSSHVGVLADRMESEWGRLVPGWQKEAVIACDPTMFHTRSEASDETAADVLMQKGWYVTPGIQSPESRYRAMSKLCLENTVDVYGNAPRLQVNVNTCPAFFAAMNGGCTVPKTVEGMGNFTKDKGHSSHVCEAGEYAAAHINVNGVDDQGSVDDLLKMVHQTRR